MFANLLVLPQPGSTTVDAPCEYKAGTNCGNGGGSSAVWQPSAVF